eukprot:5632159-Prymnesium_polylepis.2
MQRYPKISRSLAEREIHLYLFSPTDYLASQTPERKVRTYLRAAAFVPTNALLALVHIQKAVAPHPFVPTAAQGPERGRDGTAARAGGQAARACMGRRPDRGGQLHPGRVHGDDGRRGDADRRRRVVAGGAVPLTALTFVSR